VGAHRLTHPEHDITVQPFGQNWGDKLGGAVKNNPGYNTGFPQVTFANDNFYSWDSSKLWDEYHTVYGLDENISWIKNNHSFKFGYSYQILMLNTNNRNNSGGSFTFDCRSNSPCLVITAQFGKFFRQLHAGAAGGFTIPEYEDVAHSLSPFSLRMTGRSHRS
jgi:hypothetical protein